MYIRVTPLDALRILVTFTNVAREFPTQIWCGTEHAACNDIPLDLVEPEFNSIGQDWSYIHCYVPLRRHPMPSFSGKDFQFRTK